MQMKVRFMVLEIRLFGFKKVSETLLKELIRTLACSHVAAFSVKISIYLSHEDIGKQVGLYAKKCSGPLI